MQFASVYHRTSDNYCYPLNEEDLIVNIKTGYDVKKVFLHYGDPFSAGILGGSGQWKGKREEIPFKKSLKNQLWWTTTVKPKYKRCRYFFELITDTEVYYYFESGFLTKEEYKNTKTFLQYFTFPWMNSIDINKTPRWVNETVWYQIFPERFCNGDSSLNPKDVIEWAGPNKTVRNEEKYGGDLPGIISKLDYLKDLGISGLYLTPVNESKSSHKYDTIDYYKIDHNFGNTEIMKNLVKEAHNRGIKIMLDGVFNHTGEDFAPWQDVIKNGPKSKYFNWFMINKWPFDKNIHNAKEGDYYTFAFYDNMPKLNTSNQEVIDYFVDVCEYWVKEYDIDAIRLDVANEVSHKFCKDLRIRMKSLKEDFYILGEIWNDSIPWLRGDEFDAVMNYPLGESVSDFWLEESLTKDDFANSINRCYTMYMQQTNDVLFNLLDSHDTIRLMSKIKNVDKVYQQLAVLFTMPGSACIFYGTEVVLEGGYDPDCRRCMPWKEIQDGKYDDRIEMVKKLISLRNSEFLFRSRNFHFTNEINNDRVLEYIKLDDYNNKMAVRLNCSDEDINVEPKGKVLFKHLFDDGILRKNGILIYLEEE